MPDPDKTITAAHIRDLDGFTGNARLYRLSHSVQWGGNFDGDTSGETEFVIVSAADVPFSGPETYIFPAEAEGNVVDWSEMDGSFRGALDHERAIAASGWKLVSPSSANP